MPTLTYTHVEVYVFRRRGSRVEFLSLRRGRRRDKLPGVWQPITGKMDRGEKPLAAAAREVLEESGLVPARWWALESPHLYYDPKTDSILALPRFAAEVGTDAAVRLSEEHDAWAFQTASAAGRRWLWHGQRRALEAVNTEILPGGRAARALEVKPPRTRRPANPSAAKKR